MRVVILGAGRVGAALSRALRPTVHPVTLFAARRFAPTGPLRAGLLVLAVRDAELPGWAARLADAGVLTRRTAVVHVAGSLGPEVLAPLRPFTAGVGQAHPVASFPSLRARADLRGLTLALSGDRAARRRAAEVARAVGLVPRVITPRDRAGYHAACALAANGAAALAAAAGDLLRAAGVAAPEVPRLLGSLLGSVAANVAAVGPDLALSGPIQRGEAAAVRAHRARIRRLAPAALPIFVALAERQLAMARALGDVPGATLDAVARAIAGRGPAARRG